MLNSLIARKCIEAERSVSGQRSEQCHASELAWVDQTGKFSTKSTMETGFPSRQADYNPAFPLWAHKLFSTLVCIQYTSTVRL
jgi:hypothetical protein